MTVLFVLSCEPLEKCPDVQTQQEGKVCVSVKAAGDTKSSMSVSETAVSNINVYAYRSGVLEMETYAAADEVELLLVRNAVYKIYALANCGEVHAPLQESDLASLSLSPSDMAMCFREGREITAGASQAPLIIPLTRLFARYILLLDKNLEKCDYRITSVRVRQQAAAVNPFASASAAAQTADGDSASAADLVALNNGQGAVFYVPENCQGVLLPGNSDPWRKIPSNLPSAKRNLCTYLHIEGEWTTDGASADLSFNLMLGADNCSDFNVVRNSSVTITLSVNDSGTSRNSWKVEMENLDDQRILAFQNSAYVVMQEDGWTQIPLSVSPPDLEYSAVISGPEEPVMEAKVENGNVYVRGLYFGDLRPASTLTVTSWDGRVSAYTNLMLNYRMSEFSDYIYFRPDYPGQYGYIQLSNVSDTHPVLLETETWSTTVAGLKGEGNDVEYHLDSQNHVEYYIVHNQRRLYIRMLETGGGTTYVQMTRHHTRTRILMNGAVNPGLAIGNADVSEAGNRQYSQAHSLYYDSSAPVYLLDRNGARLDLESFKVPVYLLTYKGLSSSQQDRVSEFLDLYGVPVLSGGGVNYGYRNETLAGTECEEIALEGNLAKAYLYGLTDYGVSNPTYPISVRVTMSSGDVLSGSGVVTGKPAFPSQRYLGSYYNYQLAPGSLRSTTTSIDFTSGGAYLAPSPNGVTWSVVHIDGNACETPSSAYSAGSVDNYSSGASLSGYTLNFAPMSGTVYPACGALGLRGSVTNPHSGRSYTGYYSLSLILYLTFGCSVVFSNSRMYVNYKPFFEDALDDDNLLTWAEFFPLGFRMTSEYNSKNYQIWLTRFTALSTLSVSGVTPPDNYQSLMQILCADMSLYRFSFLVNGNNYNSVLLDRSASGFTGLGDWSVDGSKGYFRLLRQYDLGNLDDYNYNGLENYILEAAYDSFNL